VISGNELSRLRHIKAGPAARGSRLPDEAGAGHGQRHLGHNVDTVVTRDYLDLRLAELKAEMLKWMFGVVGLQTLAILGGMAAFLRLIR
jgi:hypothetical protein